MKGLHQIRRASISTLVCAGALALSDPARAGNGPQYFDYQVLLPPPPTTLFDAIATLDNREQAVLASVACGEMLTFAQDSVKQEADEGSAARIMAKIEWGAGHVDSRGAKRISGPCQFSETIRWADFANKETCALVRDKATCINSDDQSSDDQKKKTAQDFEKKAYEPVADEIWTEITSSSSPDDPLSTLKNSRLKNIILEPVLGQGCESDYINRAVFVDHAIAGSRWLPPGQVVKGLRGGALQIDFGVSQRCLLIEAAQALSKLTIPVNQDGNQQRAGTDGQPCHIFGKINGNWDMAERDLIRIAYLIRKYGLAADGQPLQAANTHLRDDLLTLDRGLQGDSSNPIFGCGYSEGHTGSATDRAVQRNGNGTPPGDALGDFFWFLLMLAITLLAVGAVAALAGIILGDALAVAAAVGVAIAVFATNIPETENHLLNIYTAEYLNNQLIIEDLGDDLGLTQPYIDDQRAIKNWLLGRMHGFLEQDFVEYNSRSYQRDSIESIRNLFDYAGDPGRPTLPDADLRNAAHLVLDYTAAKFAIGSSQGRRIVPYRRHRQDLTQTIDADATDWNGIFDLADGTDHQVGLGLLYSGQTQQLPLGQASRHFAEEIIYAATSDYIPEATIFDLAIVRDVPIYQRIHHATEEIYSSGKGFLISGGGLATGLAYPVTGIPWIDGVVGKNDWGTGMPTTLFLTAALGPDLGLFAPGLPPDASLTDQRNLFNMQQSLSGPGRAPAVMPVFPKDPTLPTIYLSYLDDITRLDSTLKSTLGEFIRIKGEYDVSSPTYPTYDNNLCVWDGFACGTNLELGPIGLNCLGADSSVPLWTFIDSQTCKAWGYSPRTLIAIFKKDCPASQNCTNFGFFEIIDADRYAALVNASPSDDLFTKFRNQITSANASLATIAAGKNLLTSYKSVRSQTLEFSFWGHESDSDGWGISSVDGKATHKLSEWPFAGGEWSSSGSLLRSEVQTPMKSAGDGVVEITSPRLKSFGDPTKPRVLRLDFSDQNHPKAAVEN